MGKRCNGRCSAEAARKFLYQPVCVVTGVRAGFVEPLWHVMQVTRFCWSEKFCALMACTIFIISQAISITPGSVGTYEGFFLLVLSTFGARPAALVAAVAVLSHVGNIAALLLSGAVGALWLRISRPALPVGSQRPVAG